jgi:hypothetical protein
LQIALAAQVSGDSIISLTPGALYAKRGLDGLLPLLINVQVMFLYREQLETLLEKSSVDFSRSQDTKTLLKLYFLWRSEKGIISPHIALVKEKLNNSKGFITESFLQAGSGIDGMSDHVGTSVDGEFASMRIDDSTGAGDAAAAGFLSALLDGSDLQNCVNQAFRCSAQACSELGARTAIGGEDHNALLSSRGTPTHLI